MSLRKLRRSENEMSMIEVEGLTKRFKRFTAVDQVTFAVKKGEIFGFLGPNGAGRTTTIRMLCMTWPRDEKEREAAIANEVNLGWLVEPQAILSYPCSPRWSHGPVDPESEIPRRLSLGNMQSISPCFRPSSTLSYLHEKPEPRPLGVQALTHPPVTVQKEGGRNYEVGRSNRLFN